MLTDMLKDDLSKPTLRSHATPPIIEVYTALRFYATGTFQLVDGELCSISQPSASRSIRRVSVALSHKADEIINFPSEDEALARCKADWYDVAGMPDIVGAIDGTHVEIQSPGPFIEYAYVNRKNKHSINVQAICTANRKFINIVAKWPGSTHDSRIFKVIYAYKYSRLN